MSSMTFDGRLRQSPLLLRVTPASSVSYQSAPSAPKEGKAYLLRRALRARAENCSCMFGISAIPGGQMRDGAYREVFTACRGSRYALTDESARLCTWYKKGEAFASP